VGIPHVFHHIWLGADPLPDRFARFRESWAKHHPGWELRLWTEENLPSNVRCPAIAERLRHPAERADLLRLEVLWREGGVYVDTDFECLRSIEALLDGLDFFAGYIGPGKINNALIGAAPGHPLLDRALDEARPREFHGYDKEATGPLLLNRIVQDAPGVTIFPAPYFYPADGEERATAYAIHHAERSWQDRDALLQRLHKAHARLEKSERRRKELELQAATGPGTVSRLLRALRRAVSA
jgi:inositol phosphorylceramide mannosyltransferase catalytic subunit